MTSLVVVELDVKRLFGLGVPSNREAGDWRRSVGVLELVPEDGVASLVDGGVSSGGDLSPGPAWGRSGESGSSESESCDCGNGELHN